MSAQYTVRVDLSLDPFIKAYILRDPDISRRYTDGAYSISSTDLLGVVLMQHFKLRPKDYFPKIVQIPQERKLTVDLGVKTSRWLRCYLPDESVCTVNRYFRKMIRRDAMIVAHSYVTCGYTLKAAINKFYETSSVNPDDLPFDGLYKHYNRLRKPLESPINRAV